MRGDLRAIFPGVAQWPDEIKRPGDDDGVIRSGPVESVFECRFWLGNDREMRGVMRRDFRELGDGNGSRSARLRENNLCRVRKKNARNFVDRFVAQRAKDQPNFAASSLAADGLCAPSRYTSGLGCSFSSRPGQTASAIPSTIASSEMR
jgi:hypothetical protein